ncbi:hypothetical protein EHS13_34675 [Paenibacillus psychroresistens]|uniref:ATP-grasp domain-containing protein n=1 Tax=Paenibacillus psychroresistens TaxID=1778678 RepID=A0A6B8RWU0_9BACL|nr:hypothetical protein [Paenibacillus psychroresistens]QGQ99646.1 hypothetical protein EHS13_34675 [Paenibacillus psychroresistens]
MNIKITDSKPLNILLTGGRAPVTLELARQFTAAGHRVYVAESLNRYLCRVSSAVTGCFKVPEPRFQPDEFIDALCEIAIKQGIDLIIPTCEEIFYVARGLERLKLHCTVFTDSFSKLTSLHNKLDFIQKAAGYGFIVPETRLIQSAEEWRAALSAFSPENGLVFKPVYSRFAAKTLIIEPSLERNSQVDLENLQHQYPVSEISVTAPWVVQAYIPGQLISTYSIVHDGIVSAHAAYETSYKAGLGASIFFKPLQHIAVFNWIRRFVELEQFTGQIAFDFIETSEGKLYPLECNPRATSGTHLFEPADRLDQAFISFASSKPLTPKPTTRSMLSLAMLSYGFAGIRTWKHLRAWISAYSQSKDVIFRWRDPFPYVEQLRVLFATWQMSRKLQISMVEALTYDIEWNGEA